MSLFEHYAPRGLECVCGNLRMAARAVSSIYDRHLKAVGLQSSQMAVLWAVAGRRSAPVNEIAGVIAMDETTLLRNLRVLERRRLVAFHVGDDRRERIVQLTAEGRALFESALPAWKEAQGEVAKVLDGGSVDDMNRKLVRLTRSLR
ncbi:MAG TPA: MarR family winged helix-turn-helix transcriptional regulator [Caldimonas sp.]|nr:MarR family winged helix-turn-helix transcriptional regulator [Caldimonas sp.]